MITAWRRRSADWVRAFEPLLRTARVLVGFLLLLTLVGLTNVTTLGTITIPGGYETASGR